MPWVVREVGVVLHDFVQYALENFAVREGAAIFDIAIVERQYRSHEQRAI